MLRLTRLYQTLGRSQQNACSRLSLCVVRPVSSRSARGIWTYAWPRARPTVNGCSCPPTTLPSLACPSTIRCLASNTTGNVIRELDESVYKEVSSRAMNLIIERLDNDDILCSNGNYLEVDYMDGVLDVSVEDVGTWVINTHNASKQIWVSSPISGPSKYYYEEESHMFCNERDSQLSLQGLLINELRTVIGDSSFCFEDTF